MIYSGFHIVAMGLYSKRGCQNVVVTDTLSCTLFATYYFFYHILTFSVTLFLNRSTATWNLVVKYIQHFSLFFPRLSRKKTTEFIPFPSLQPLFVPLMVESLVMSINFVPYLIWLWYHCKYFKGLSITWLQVCIFSLNFHKSYVHLFLQA